MTTDDYREDRKAIARINAATDLVTAAGEVVATHRALLKAIDTARVVGMTEDAIATGLKLVGLTDWRL